MGASGDYVVDGGYMMDGGDYVMSDDMPDMPVTDGWGGGYGGGGYGGGYGGGHGGKRWGHGKRGGGGECRCRMCHRKFNFLMWVIMGLVLTVIVLLALLGKKMKYF